MNDLIDALRQAVPGSVDETTTSANIAFLPSGFLPAKKALKTLAMFQRKWGLKVLESGHYYLFRFGSALCISVLKEDLESFGDLVLKISGKPLMLNTREIDLTPCLFEAKEEEIQSAYDDFTYMMEKRVQVEPFRDILSSVDLWTRSFGAISYDAYPQALLKMNRNKGGQLPLKQQILTLSTRLRERYADDLGQMQIITEAVQQREAMNSFSVFEEYDFLYGSRVRSKYKGVLMLLESTISMSWDEEQSIHVSDPGVLDWASEQRDMRVVKKTIIPRTKAFNTNFFKELRTHLLESF